MRNTAGLSERQRKTAIRVSHIGAPGSPESWN
jgi:hypothetical protein